MPEMQQMLNCSLVSEGYRVATAGSGEEALARIEEQEFDLIVTDIVMPGLSGLEVLEKSQLLNPRAMVILMTAYATLETAVTALRHGACDYIEKPLHLDELHLRVRRALDYREALWRARLQQRALLRPLPADALVGESGNMRVLLEQIARSARTPSNVLITGESGVGKELVARAIHRASPRCERTFIAVNCGAIPEALLESQLFGHLRGAFTTAVQANPGLFVTAHRGTLLLDEIGDLPFPLQVKLLRVIEERHVWPVGATKPVPVDVRIIASTNRDLAREVEAGRFREDLFYRLNVVHLQVPPLRERRSDIPLLVDHLIDRLNAKLDTRCLGIEREALWVLMTRPWKGNVRELENVLERAMVLGSDDLISLPHLPADSTAAGDIPPRDLREALRRFERQHLMSVIAETRSDKRAAARLLGISLASLYRKLNLMPGDGAEPAREE
jgi:two-component system response regulator PilR (NtrC family)